MGKGEFFGFLMQGASPLASPGLNPGGTGTGAAYHAPSGGLAPALPDKPAVAIPDGGHGGFGRRIYQPYHKVLSPIPPTPFPRGEGGVFWFISPGATAPGTPAPKPGRRGGRGRNPAPSGGLAPALPDNPAVAIPDGGSGGFGRRLSLPHHEFLSPIPPPPSRREGGDF